MIFHALVLLNTTHVSLHGYTLEQRGKTFLSPTDCFLTICIEKMSSFSFLYNQRVRKKHCEERNLANIWQTWGESPRLNWFHRIKVPNLCFRKQATILGKAGLCDGELALREVMFNMPQTWNYLTVLSSLILQRNLLIFKQKPQFLDQCALTSPFVTHFQFCIFVFDLNFLLLSFMFILLNCVKFKSISHFR